MSAVVLYTPAVLSLATNLAAYPLDPALPLQREARSRSCGSAITLGLALDERGAIEQVGVRSQACAIGQAAAAIFASQATGKDAASVAEATAAIEAWLAGEGEMPAWPGLEAIAAARDYPARHNAILLAWRAARELLFTDEVRR